MLRRIIRKIYPANITVAICLFIVVYTLLSAIFQVGVFSEKPNDTPKTIGLSRITSKMKTAFSASITENFEKYSGELPEEEAGEGELGAGEKEARLGLAYLLGEKDGLDKETKETLRLVGLTHLVVASGMHLGILVGFFKRYFGKISRFAGMLYSLLFVLLFGEMIGWTASITRAAIVAGVSILAWYSGHRVEAWRMILLAMAITLLINPRYIADLGWLLSFASLFGIMILMPELKRFFYGSSKAKVSFLTDTLLASVAATLMCIPILLYFFGQISLISAVANLLIMPTIALAMGLTFLVGLVGFLPIEVFWWLQAVVVWVAKLLLDYHLIVMEFFSRQTMFLIQIPKNNWLVLLLYVPFLAPFAVGGIIHAETERRRIKMFQAQPEKYLRFAN